MRIRVTRHKRDLFLRVRPTEVKKYADERLAKEKREMEEKQAREADAAPGAYKNRPKEETDPFAWAKGQDTQAQVP